MSSSSPAREESQSGESPTWELASQLEARPAFGPAEVHRLERVGEYELLEELGRGGMGVVYRARRGGAGPDLALKMLRARQGDGELRARFLREGRAAARLRHESLVTIHEVGEERGCPFLVMELVRGGTLQERLEREGPLPPHEAAWIVSRLADALHLAHEVQVLHRDVKPGNVLVGADREPRLTDFGLAKLLDDEALITRGSQTIGTPQFMSPEQATGQAVDARTDVWGLGATLYALLTGAPPFGVGNASELLQQIVHGPVEPPSRRRSGIEPALDAICLTCLEKDPARRYPSARALSEDLIRYVERRPVRARQVGAGGPGALRPAGAALGVGLLLVLAVVFPTRHREGQVEPPSGSAQGPDPGGEVTSAPGPSHAPRPPEGAGDPWAARWAQASQPQPRPVGASELAAWTLAAGEALELAEAGRDPPPELVQRLEEAAAAGHALAQHAAGRLLLESDPARAGELLWRASRQPDPAPGARLDLARHLAGGDEGARAVARHLLREEDGQDERSLARAACAWARLGGPGDLARGLRLARRLRERAALLRVVDPLGRVLHAVAAWEGWGGDPDPAGAEATLGAALAGGPAGEAGAHAARDWLACAGAVGDPAARRLQPPARPEELDPLLVLAFDGSRAVRRPELDEVTAAAAEVEAVWGPEGSEPDTLPAGAVAALRPLAEARRHWGAQLALARCYGAGLGVARDPRLALVFAGLAGLDDRESTGRGLAAARVAVGRALLVGLGCAADPREGLAWLESGRERADDAAAQRPAVLEAELWLGLAQVWGAGRPRDVAAGLSRACAARAEARSLGVREPILERLAEAAPVHAGAARALPLLRTDDGAVGRLALEAVAGDAEARAWLEGLVRAESGPWRSAPRKALALVLLLEGRRTEEARALLAPLAGEREGARLLEALEGQRLDPHTVRAILERLATDDRALRWEEAGREREQREREAGREQREREPPRGR